MVSDMDNQYSKFRADIQRISSVGRATFYRNFDTMVDVLYWKCDLEYKKVMESYTNMISHDNNEYEFLTFFFNYWMEHYEILDILIRIGRYDIISQCHYNNAPILYNYFKDNMHVQFLTSNITWLCVSVRLLAF